MKIEEYDERKKLLIASHEKSLFELAREFALSKATVKIGDVVSDGRVTIKIEQGEIQSWGTNYPYVTWCGPEFTKKMMPRKDKSKGYIRDDSIRELKQVS